MLILILALTFGGIGLEPQISEPQNGSFLSGKVLVKLECDNTELVVKMQLIRNDQIVFEQAGWIHEVPLDFGSDVKSWRLALRVWDEQGTSYLSETVTTRSLRIDYEETARLIQVPAVVKDRKNRNIPNLKQNHFKVRQDGELCDIRLIERQKVPLKIALLVDSSSSLRQEETILKEAVLSFVSQLDEQDRSCLIIFNNDAQLVFDFGASLVEIEEKIESIKPSGATALFDGLLLAENHLKELPRSRKTIVLFTDGRDSIYEEVEAKRRMLKQVVERAQNEELAIFAIGLGDKIHSDALGFLADETGGRFLFAASSGDLTARFAEVLDDLKNQYVLHVDPVNQSSGFHRLEVNVNRRGARVHARRGFVIE